jgi:DNA invertase Pin-like site-specific DNA recombinase
MKQAIAYLRKSTDMQETSLEQQRKDILVFANANAIKVIRFFEEEACGESVEGRPQFRAMVEFCKTSREPFQYVLVPDISRWGRFQDPTETFYWIHEVKKYQKEVIFVNEGFKDENIGTSLMKLIKSSEASEYLKKIRQNTIRGMKFHASKGYWMGGKAPYGYERIIAETGQILKDGQHKNIKDQKIKLVIDKKEAKLIKLIYVLYGEKGLSNNYIVNYLNEGNMPAPNGNKWTKSTIWSILHNQTYIGNAIYNIRNYHKRNGKGIFNPKKDWLVAENTHEAISCRKYA